MRLPADIPAAVSRLLDILRPLVKKTAMGEFKWPQWCKRGRDASSVSSETKSHIESLRLLGFWGIPLMEIHDLGDFEIGPVLNSRVVDIFDPEQDTFVIHNWCLKFGSSLRLQVHGEHIRSWKDSSSI